MPLYLGNEKVKVMIDGKKYNLNVIYVKQSLPINVLMSSEGFVLKDINGLYLVSKERE